jgi:hypothetical protein
LAYRLLLGMTTGIVPDGLDELELDDVEWAGDSTILLDYAKGRSGPESLTLSKPAVRVLRRWLEHSALLREFTPEPERSHLWLVYFQRNRWRSHTGDPVQPTDSAALGPAPTPDRR